MNRWLCRVWRRCVIYPGSCTTLLLKCHFPAGSPLWLASFFFFFLMTKKCDLPVEITLRIWWCLVCYRFSASNMFIISPDNVCDLNPWEIKILQHFQHYNVEITSWKIIIWMPIMPIAGLAIFVNDFTMLECFDSCSFITFFGLNPFHLILLGRFWCLACGFLVIVPKHSSCRFVAFPPTLRVPASCLFQFFCQVLFMFTSF